MKKNKTQHDIRAGVWMDHHIAYIISHDDNGEYIIHKIESEADKHIPAKNNKLKSEARKHGRENDFLKKFYKEIQKNLKDFDHILLTGPTTASVEFHHYLSDVSSFTGKRIAEEKSPKMTKRQMIAFMKKKLGKPMDIFRQDEVV